ncbi:MAG: ABC transporter ATP-binding protein [Spirochaetia bacterium]|nr:ABC transporter ATP-binding protein [Spirochaetia bacterium]
MLELREISKAFGRKQALSDVSLALQPGECTGIIGPNGSGKTTLINIILGLLRPDSGTYDVDGIPFATARTSLLRSIGAVTEQPRFYPGVSARVNLRFIARACGLVSEKERIETVLKFADLSDHADRVYGSYSLGMRQRLSIAAALLSDPQIVIFDEPTNGLDPEGIRLIRTKIIDLKAQGKTIILCSHLMSEVQQVCTRFAILSEGRVLQTATVEDVIGGKARTIVIAATNLEKLRLHIEQKEIGQITQEHSGSITLKVSDKIKNHELLKQLVDSGIEISSFAPAPTALEDYFTSVLSAQ